MTITNDANHRLVGTFSTALEDSGFFGETVPIVGVHQGDCVSFTFARGGRSGDTICSFTGVLQDGRIQTLWHVVRDTVPWPHAAQTNADTFERID